ncbi:ATP-grasp domain-containing protein [Peribacillus sp. ACCC06369]|uniref:ATP-grasp domain-containing protein n=1 Tax=Peribacillus sp. ACCC06369 TaxID=3055860 RepID=UPI0025A24AC4|nr:ATP-grasp domain-containing protein [Peribacillus sp. ACCC06369]MDM5359872.1 ATP-grasp domain-containing protein [Peribacillus sp. ACCC06369]
MILGASILQLPAILKAKKMGLHVIAVDMDKNAVGFEHSDVCLNISTIDIPKIVDAAKLHEIDGIMTLASDLPIRTVAAVSEELNIVGISKETAINVTNKASMRAILNQHSVPIPMFFRVVTQNEYLNAIQFFQNEFVVKPADNSGSRGVILVDDINNEQFINYAFEYSKKYSRSGEIIVEEFMEGPEVSVETLSFDGHTHIIAITDKVTTGSPEFVEMGHSIPSQLSIDTKLQIEKVVIAAIKAVGINNGPSHTEIIITKDGPKVVELGARLGGDNITTHLVPFATGVDMVEACIEIAFGNNPVLNKRISMGSAIRYFKTKKGKILNIYGEQEAEKLPGIKEITFTKNIGDNIEEINSSVDRVGYVIAQSKDAVEAIKICEEAVEKMIIEI